MTMTDGDGEASRKKGDHRKVSRVMTNREGLPKLRKLDQSGSEHHEHHEHHEHPRSDQG
ncbi:hypothetical protein M433DRAFT_160997, partial [Acidomyces richmondensis BFW]